MGLLDTIKKWVSTDKVLMRLNPTGTHSQHGYMKVRIDFYPRKTDRTYSTHHVQVPIIPEEGYPGAKDDKGNPVDEWAYNFWLESLPKEWQDNPCLCHFIKIGDADTQESLTEYIKDMFPDTVLKTLDDVLADHDVKTLQRMTAVRSRTQFAEQDVHQTISMVNQKFLDFEVRSGD